MTPDAVTPVEHAWLSVDDLGSLLRGRQLSCQELLRTVLARIDAANPVLHAFITITADEAMRAAEQADLEISRGEHRGPLHGIPIGLKDALDLAGVRCTFGSRILADRVPTADAAAVDALQQAGAVIVGKQNLHEFAYGITGENPHFGDVANPWDTARVTGGSSSGTAASLAAGLVPLGLGTDTGGSVRIPAAMCGVVGLKPSFNLISRQGVLPLAGSLDHVGPMARTVLDCFALLDAVAGGPRYADQVRRSADAGIGNIVIGRSREHFFDDLAPEVETAVERALEALERLGARLVDVSLPSARQAQAAGATIMGVEAAAWHEAWMRDRPSEYGPDVLSRLQQGALTADADYREAQKVRTSLRSDFERVFQSVDVLVSPTVPIVAPLRGRTFEPTGERNVTPRAVINRLTVPANLTGSPAITVPCNTGSDLPVGLQVMGPMHQEAVVGTVALAYERVSDRVSQRPSSVD